MKKIKILAVADLHGDVKKAEDLASKAVDECVDIVVMCGDFVSHTGKHDNMIGPFLSRGKKVFLIAGNHESPEETQMIADIYGIRTLHGSYAIYEGVGLFGSGGADIGLKGIPDSEILSNLKESFEGVKLAKKKLMVTHVHPSGGLMEKLCLLPSSKGVRQAIEELKPDVLVCGHVHEGAGLEEQIGHTRVINVAKDGKIIEF